MSTFIADLRAKRDEARDAAIALAESDDFDPADPTYSQAAALAERYDAQIVTLDGQYRSRAAQNSVTLLDTDTRDGAPDRTPGALFVRSAQFTEWHGRGTMSPVDLDLLQSRAPLTTADFTIPTPQRAIEWLAPKTPILDMVPVIPVPGGSVDVVTYQLTNNAAVVAEGTAKPESGLGETPTNYPVPTIAHWMQMSRQLMEDAPAVRARVDNGLRRGVMVKLEAEASAAVIGGTYNNIVEVDILAALRRSIGDLEAAGYSPNIALLNPADYADLDIATQGVTGQAVSQPSYWGLRIVPTAGITAGETLVADAGSAFETYRRNTVGVYITDSHASTFISNVFTLLAEARQVTVVVQPNAVQTSSAVVVAARQQGGKGK